MKMKKGFTLIELLVVVVVIAILMSISFGLLNVGKDDELRRKTIVKIQKLENAISGYYAAFGSYPPVPVTGSRNIFHKVTEWGSQQIEGADAEPDYKIKLQDHSDRVEAACRSQMMGAAWPWGHKQDADKVTKTLSNAKKHHDAGRPDLQHPIFGVGAEALTDVQRIDALAKSEPSWSYVQVFRFGLISFLLPRYLIMMDHGLTGMFDEVEQWKRCNEPPSKFDDGVPYASWEEISKKVRRSDDNEYLRQDDAREIGLLPSQIVTTRWLPNLEKSLMFLNPNKKKKFIYYGVELKGDSDEDASPYDMKQFATKTSIDPGMFFPVYSCNNNQSGERAVYANAYVLDGVTMCDAYRRELYYYSPPPYQSYCIWSSGKDQKTFPPWMSEKEIDAMGTENAKTARSWKADDIMHMSN